MIDSKHHVQLDGVKYRLAESSEGQHHAVRGEPLRPPNAVTVQGENAQKFQPRQEVLLWNWTDWSGGEGQRTYKFGQANRSWRLQSVRAFEKPGKLMPGYYIERTQDSTGAADFNQQTSLVKGAQLGLVALARGNTTDGYSVWDDTNKKWGAWTGLIGPSLGNQGRPVADSQHFYFHEYGTQDVWKVTNGFACTKISTGEITSSVVSWMAILDDYVYVYLPWVMEVWEISKAAAGTGATLIDEWEGRGDTNLHTLHPYITETNGRVYVATVYDDYTTVREITPSSAAGTGFGAEIGRIDGFVAEGFWSHQGTIYMSGRYRDPATERAVLYMQPGGAYGTLGEVRPGDNLDDTQGGGLRMLDHFFIAEHRSASDTEFALFQLDSVSGGFAELAYDAVGAMTGTTPESITAHDGDIFFTTQPGAGNDFIGRADYSRYPHDSLAISPEHDFDLVSNKFLSSMVLACEPLPADWTVYVDYQLDGDGTWTNAITYTTDNGTGTSVAITTDSTTVEFRRLQMRIRFDYTGAGIASSCPVVNGVEARAVVAEKVQVFQLLLDLSSDQSAGSQSKDGASKVDSFLTTAVKATSVDYRDGYTSPRAGEWDSYDVFVDDYAVILDRPGEGFAAVTLREVI